MNLAEKLKHPKFWVKNYLYYYTPGGYGYYRDLQKCRDDNFDFEKDKHEVRKKHHGKGGWKEEREDGLQVRDYSDYDEYVDHQSQKWDEMLKGSGGFSNDIVCAYRNKFYNRFKYLERYIKKDANILCAGARQGTEVEVLQDIGYANAYGIDLNPGPDNPWVKKGDFMNLEAKDDSLDLVYCNAVDHAYNLDGFFEEHVRALKPMGYALYEVGVDADGGAFEAVDWDNDAVIFQKILTYFKRVVKVEVDYGWQWMLFAEPKK